MKYAWVENSIIRDIAPEGDPAGFYHPDVAKFYNTPVPANAENGDTFISGVLTKRPVPPPAPPAPPAPRTWTADNFRTGMTLTEKAKWDSDSKPEIVTAKLELATPKALAATTELLDFLVTAAVISAATKTKILA